MKKIITTVIIGVISKFLIESIYPIFSEVLKYYANKIYKNEDICSLLIQVILCIGICIVSMVFINLIKFIITEYNGYKSYKEITNLH